MTHLIALRVEVGLPLIGSHSAHCSGAFWTLDSPDIFCQDTFGFNSSIDIKHNCRYIWHNTWHNCPDIFGFNLSVDMYNCTVQFTVYTLNHAIDWFETLYTEHHIEAKESLLLKYLCIHTFICGGLSSVVICICIFY